MSGSMIVLTAADGHKLDAYKAVPAGKSKGSVVILQEIFGVSPHIKHVADEYAAAGYVAIAPAMFDRIEKGVVIGYTEIQRGRDIVGKLTEAMVLADMDAAAAAAGGPVVPIGYCWGGAQAYVAACKGKNVAGAVNYYGSRTVQYCETMVPRVPVLYHFGALDKSLPPEGITKIKAAHPAGIFHIYENADHGFNCEERPQYNAAAAKLAKERTLKFLADVLQ